MRWLIHSSLACGLLAVGYLLGASGLGLVQPLRAQEETAGPSDETRKKLQESLDSLKSTANALQQEGLYVPATRGLNAFAVTVGGVNALEDLDSGRGVDPETFAALYAGLAVEEVAEHLTEDKDGRLLYKNKLVRMYPISRLKTLYGQRLALAGERTEEDE